MRKRMAICFVCILIKVWLSLFAFVFVNIRESRGIFRLEDILNIDILKPNKTYNRKMIASNFSPCQRCHKTWSASKIIEKTVNTLWDIFLYWCEISNMPQEMTLVSIIV